MQLHRRGLLLGAVSVPQVPAHYGAPGQVFKVAMVSDNDKRSGSAQRPGQFMAYLATLQLQQQRQHNGGSSYAYSLSAPQVVNTSNRTGLNNSSKDRSDTTAPWQCLPALPPPGLPLLTGYGFGGRGGELSDLLLTPGGGRLLTVDDHTGLVFEVLPELDGVGAAARLGCGSAKLVPRWVLANAAGAGAAGFKAEWCVASGLHPGYEVWPQGTSAAQPGLLPLPSPLQLVARVNLSSGHTTWEDWAPMYRRLATALGVTPPGYVTHEACTWSERHEGYFFLPRRVSLNEAWDRRLDESRGAQLLLSCSRAGGDVRVVEVRGATDPRRGYSAMRFLPRTQDQHIVALKTEEPWAGGPCCSYLTVLDLDGQVLLPETLISSDMKYEGLEVWPLQG
ncbi:apyrase-domain-containing protein [Haematococcus lacustris]